MNPVNKALSLFGLQIRKYEKKPDKNATREAMEKFNRNFEQVKKKQQGVSRFKGLSL